MGYHLALSGSGKVGLPFMFNMHQTSARLVSNFILYWLTPFTLAAFTFKALPRPEARWLLLITVGAFSALLWLQIQRCPEDVRKRKNLTRWLALATMLVIGVFGFTNSELLYRQMDLFKAELKGQDLRGVNLTQLRYFMKRYPVKSVS